jgi:hypothetical protein
MSITLSQSAFVVGGGAVISLASAFAVTGSSSNPTYLILAGDDINQYPVSASQATGALTGANGATVPFYSLAGDATQRAVDLVFTYQTTSGRYYNSSYGYFDQMSYIASASTDDLINFSLFGTDDPSLRHSGALDPATLANNLPQDFLGSATFFTSVTTAVPSVATPASLAAVAASFIGQVWNDNGCWGEAAAIAAKAGVGLPIAAGFSGLAGQKMGEWTVAFDGVTGQTGDWRSMVRQGDVIGLVDSDGVTGHITTCVAGGGANALLVDDAYFVNSTGAITNPAGDGSANDIIVTPLLAGGEFTGVATASVVIYRLDTPVVADLVSAAVLAPGATLALSTLFSAASPDGHAITEWQVYNIDNGNDFLLGGSPQTAHGAAAALSIASLAALSFGAGAAIGTDALEIRAYNGSYWGDWQALDVTVSAAGAQALPSLPSGDPAITAFIAAQNAATRGSAGVALLNNGIAGGGGDSVIGEMSATLTGGVNAMVLDGDIGAFSWQIDATGALTLFDGNTGGTTSVSGITDLLFDGALQNQNGSYAHLLLILNGPDSEVARFYQAALGRVPDLPGMEYWIDQMAGGLSLTAAAQDFFASPEFTQRFGAAGTLSDDSYITLLYQNVLQRTPAASELAYYATALGSGESRLTLFFDFASSQELINNLSPAKGGWLVDTALGGNASSDFLMSAGTVISQAATDNYLDTSLISPQSVNVGQVIAAGGIALTEISATSFSITVTSAGPGFTLLMSAADRAASLSVSGAILYSGSGGGDRITLNGSAANDTLVLAGGGNVVAFAANATGSATLSGFAPGSDHIDLTAFKFSSYAALLADATVSGGTLQIHQGPTILLTGLSTPVAADFLL